MTSFRRSTLQGFAECPRRTLHEITLGLNIPRGNVGVAADLGSAAHAVFDEMLRTLQRQGETQMATEEAMAIMREVLANGKWVLPLDAMEDLRWVVLRFAGLTWRPERILAIEEALKADVACPDGVTRTVYGTPDVVIADPPDGFVVLDHKTGLARPRSPRDMPTEGPIVGKQYLSEQGLFQGTVYALLLLRSFPRAQRVIFREHHLRWNDPPREMVLSREELEHVEFEVGLLMQKLDEALRDGEESGLWYPRPGRHCARKCPVARSCPVPAEQRGVGALEDSGMAAAEAGRYVMVDGLRNGMRDALKTFHEQTGEFIPVGDGSVIGWERKPDGKRAFGVHLPRPEAVEA